MNTWDAIGCAASI